jgi:hypothetical protein
MSKVRNTMFLAAALILNAVLAVPVRAQFGPYGADVPMRAVGQDERALVINAVLAKLQQLYVYEQIAREMDAAIRGHEAAGAYDRLNDAARFAEMLTRDLQAVSRDKHLVVSATAEPIATSGASGSATTTQHLPADEPTPCAFVNVGRLAGNVGYLKFDSFGSPSLCADSAAAAMTLLAGCDALIYDLRDNFGGDPAMVAFLSSYLFAKPVHLGDVYERRTNATYESWTLPFVPGPRSIDKPVFILVSRRTFSAAEEFAYNLQMLHRALVIGEPSGGGAHPSESFPIDAGFQITLPIARYVNPVSRTNWEGRGVEPDVRVAEPLAVQYAYREALQGIVRTLTSPIQRTALQRQIDTLTGIIDAVPSSSRPAVSESSAIARTHR